MQVQIKLINIKRRMEKMKREMDGTLEYIDKILSTDDTQRPRCEICGWRNLRMRKNKTYFCNSCGHDTIQSGDEPEEVKDNGN